MFGKKVKASATILADEGYKYARNSATEALQHETFIVEVHPDDEPAFRTEVKAWVDWTAMPQEGDVVQVVYEHGTHKADLQIEGDPRYDWNLRKATSDAASAVRRDELLHGSVGPTARRGTSQSSDRQSGDKPSGDIQSGAPRSGAQLDPDLQALMDQEEAERSGPP